MTTLTEGRHAGEFILSEASGTRSRESVTIESGQDLGPGAVLGKKANGKYVAVDQAASDGSETAIAILIDACDATTGDKKAAIIARDAEVNGNCLDWGSQSAAEETTGAAELLAQSRIVVR